MSKLMEDSWNHRGKFEYHQLLGEVFLFDEDWLWERLETDYAREDQSPIDDTSIIDRKLVDFDDYLAISRPMRIFDYIGSKSLANCSYCWACLLPGWMDHDIRGCIQVPGDDSTISVMEAATACRFTFAYPEGSDIHIACGAPYYFGCTDQHCRYQLTAYSVYLAAAGKASHLHEKARKTFSKRYNVDMEDMMPDELTKVMTRPHPVASRTLSALVWFIELIHDNAEPSFKWYSQYGL